MASNKVDFRILSEKTCIACDKKLKANLVNRKPNAKYCYSCYKARKSQG